jgi:hypothetical protein
MAQGEAPHGPETASPQKRPYVPPRLVVHGSVEAITLGKSGQATDPDTGSFPIP